MADWTLVGGGAALTLLGIPFFAFPSNMMGLRRALDPVSVYDSGGTSDRLAAYGLGLIVVFLGLFMIYRGLTV